MHEEQINSASVMLAFMFFSQQETLQDVSLLVKDPHRSFNTTGVPGYPYNPEACPAPKSLLLRDFGWLLFSPSPILLSTQIWQEDWPLSTHDCIPTVHTHVSQFHLEGSLILLMLIKFWIRGQQRSAIRKHNLRALNNILFCVMVY